VVVAADGPSCEVVNDLCGLGDAVGIVGIEVDSLLGTLTGDLGVGPDNRCPNRCLAV